jgi:ribose/xylose/arabinose/galactoside ABC-type transport system permease subunit
LLFAALGGVSVGGKEGAGVFKKNDNSVIKMHFGRVLLVYILIGAILGASSGMMQRWFGLPSFIGPFLTSGAVVMTAPVLNFLVRRGKVPWLLRE